MENMGRINYGPCLRDHKGITEGVLIDNQYQSNWTIYPLPIEAAMLKQVAYVEASHYEIERPAFYRGYFETNEPADTFLRFDGWHKGLVWINGFNIGRYWEAGPQRALYISGPLLRQGQNEIVLFELHSSAGERAVQLTDCPDLGEASAVDERVLNFVQEE